MNQFGFEKLRDAKKEPQARVLNWAPRIFEIEEFLSSKECDYLIRKSEPHLTRCMVGYGQGSARVVSEARTCYGTSLKSADDPIIKAIEERIALLTFFPVTHAEALHTIRYEVGQQFTDHHDFYHHPDESVAGGQRIATFLMYLNEPEDGGTTEFPTLKISVKPKRGAALLFFNTKLDEKSTERDTLHAGSPVTKGHKWVATKWLHNSPVVSK